ncbi:hypothetical protein H8D29_03480 [PVC group bacterium]|nr:hypothetical protein [PVC group bacterium]
MIYKIPILMVEKIWIRAFVEVEADDIDDAIDILNKDSEHLYSEEGRNVTYRETLKWEIDEDSLNRKETK